MVNNENFLIKNIPSFHPITQYYDRLTFFKEEKRKCIEGYWQQGKWMPGTLYYYINWHHIELEDSFTKGLSPGTPFLRDIDWELFYYYEECRGFSGFIEDDKYTCDRDYGPNKELALLTERITEKEIASKIYVSARDYLRKNHGNSLGKPLYKNSSQNFISIQARGGGKSFATAGLISHNFLFGGATDYDVYLEKAKKGMYTVSDTIVGAIDTKYTVPLLDKVRYSWAHMKGGESIRVKGDSVKYPPPFLCSFRGSWQANHNLTSKHGSKLYHRTFKDNPMAGNAGRPNLAALDEIGFFTNIIDALGAMMGSQTSKEHKNLVIWMLGTGGLFQGAAVKYAEKIFRNPSDYNCIEFEDIFEQRGKIGYFVPIDKTRNEYKSKPELITDQDKANVALQYERTKAKNNPDPRVYQSLVVNAPRIPSEAFLDPENNFFPSLLLKDHLADLMSNPHKGSDASYVGSLTYTEGKLEWKTDLELRPIREYPLPPGYSKKGAIELFEKPQLNDQNIIPFNRYIIGVDSVDKALSTTDSLFCALVFDRWTGKVVAEFTGRREDPNEAYEISRRLALYYNCSIMYEQSLLGMYTYFSNRNQTHLLAETPMELRNRDTYRINTNSSKGLPATTRVNDTGRNFIKSHLLTILKEGDSLLQLSQIKSLGLLEELIKWNPKGNFDRVSAFIQVMWYDNTLYKEEETTSQKQQEVYTASNYFKQFGLGADKSEIGVVKTTIYDYGENK
jgi:hypothetical protein